MKKIQALCVEANINKVDWIKNNFILNHVEADYQVINKAVTKDGRSISFPKISDSSSDYGARVGDIHNRIDYRGLELKFCRVKSVKFSKILRMFNRIDLLHVDIQGGESDILPAEIKLMGERVKIVVVGTHSRKIEGDLFELFFKNGWELLDENPCQFTYDLNKPTLDGMVSIDGNQVWVNNRI